ncbi:alpha/beta fold hydrolase [uncultured Parasphingopyxis sp.]|mgnify:CR=1 FL=1|uniref:alpha/beta fold hydrolase n=1 Tax=uncultured Parasphingopyxis sp. TaxID=1547918 RepID=UPI00260A313C|nr:alpha/beta fold hydrolase [uncultured Parasphingopyxis sp.]
MSDTGALLDVGDGHRIWVQTVGRRGGIPAVYLHGGPGSGCNPSQHKLFDPDRHFAVFVDQRGAGRSQPHGERRANTTTHLISDLEAVRQHLGVESWLVVGGSWGATLALAYAQAHSERVTGIVLRATFLGTAAELDWAFNQALPAFQPDLYAALMAQADGSLETLWPKILNPDPAIHTAPARAFSNAERALSDLSPAPPKKDGPLPASAFMEAHYFANDCFLEPGALMRGADRLVGIPGVIVQARLDLLCPPITSARLAAVWPDARLVLIEAAGHSLGHPAVFDAVRAGIAALSAG